MKILEEKYPKGTFKHQKTDGRYIDGLLYNNLRLLATKIVKDMTFLGIGFSSTLEVGTGKSVLFTQIGETWSDLMKDIHNIDVPFTQQNIVFRPEELIERSFQVPQYSCILLDEWEDSHYWSSLGMTLRKFFRKCRQLNLLILIIIPNYFQLPLGYAISRSIFAIDVKFDDNLERGGYDFYGFKAKKKLYIKGRKYHDYDVQFPDFNGEFFDGYGVPEKEYRRVKREDMEKYDDEDKKPPTEKDIIRKIAVQLSKSLPIKTKIDLAEAFGKSKSILYKWINEQNISKEGGVVPLLPISNEYNNVQDNNPVMVDGGGKDGDVPYINRDGSKT